MKPKFKYITIIVILLGIAVAQAATFKPFIRSRYSIRWRKTTTLAPKVLDFSTAAALREGVEISYTKPTAEFDSLTDNSIQLSTTKTSMRTSTHSTDYDYYNNEVEEGEHKN